MDLATVDKLLTTTRSVRARLDLTRLVPPELIEECLEIAVQAPKAAGTAVIMQTQPRDTASWIALHDHFEDAPALIIACTEGRPENRSPERLAGLYGNILPIAWSLMLALRARGVGAAWTTIVFTYEKEVAEILQLPENLTPGVCLPVAYFTGDDFKPATRIPARERTHWNTWGARR